MGSINKRILYDYNIMKTIVNVVSGLKLLRRSQHLFTKAFSMPRQYVLYLQSSIIPYVYSSFSVMEINQI